MVTQILATKLYIPPPRPKAVARPDLIKRLNEGLGRAPSVSLICAPAGFGKTTLISEWASQKKVAWLSLDEGDNDPLRFLAYLVAALQTVAPNMGAGTLARLQSPQPPPTEAILTLLLNDLTTLPYNLILVLDDYHAIEAKAVDLALTFLLEHLPPQLHLVITTRADPDVPLAKMRARGQLTELRATDLRFTPAEAAEFLNSVMGLRLAEADIAALEARTEGWIAGLQLAALSMQGQQDIPGFIQSFSGSHHFVLDYLLEEVLQRQPERIQTFLLATSILDRLSGPLCDAVLPDSSASGQETLEYLERANLLVVPLDNQREWYRYHHLFADVLQARLMKEQPNQVVDLHLRACAWCERNNFRYDAIRHALAAKDFERAADLIELEWSANSGTYLRSATWLGWVKALPDELVRTRSRLSVGFAWELLFLGELEAAEKRMNDADRLLEPTAGITDPSRAPSKHIVVANEETSQSLGVLLAIGRSFHAQALGDVAGTAKYARRALTLGPESDHYTRGLAGAQLGLACWTNGDLESAYKYVADAMASLQMAGNLVFATTCAYVMASIKVAQGRLLEAANINEEALQLVSAQGEPILQGTADLYLGLSKLYREQGNVEAAGQHLLRSEELGKRAALPDWPYAVYLAQAQIKEDQGDLKGALELLDKAERLYHRNPVPNVHPVAAVKTRVWIRQGRLAEALDWVHRRQLSVDDDLSYLSEFEHITLARVLIACYRSVRSERSIDEAVGLLERLLKAAEDGGRMGSIIEILVLQALAHEANGDISLALVPLERALSLAEPERYVRLFVDEGIPIAELLTRLNASREGGRPVVSEVVVRHNHRLLAAFGKQKDVKSTAVSSQPLVEPLSERELEVLRLLGTELNGPEIALELGVSQNTMRTHIRNIYSKLGVNNRRSAVRRAEELALS